MSSRRLTALLGVALCVAVSGPGVAAARGIGEPGVEGRISAVGASRFPALVPSSAAGPLGGTPGEHHLLDVESLSGGDALAVGYGGGDRSGRAWRWDGSDWSSTHPPCGTLCWMQSSDAVSHHVVWAGGVNGGDAMTQRWNGRRWTQVPVPPPGDGSSTGFYDISGSSNVDVWAVGYKVPYESDDAFPLMEHFDGKKWTSIDSVMPPPKDSALLNGVLSLSQDDAWAIGGGGSINICEHWDGKRWSQRAKGLPQDIDFSLGSLSALSSRDVWAVGSSYVGTRQVTAVVHWDGRRWSTVPSPSRSGPSNMLEDVTAIAPDDVWAVGESGARVAGFDRTLVEHWDGERWRIVPSPSPGATDDYLHGVSAGGADDVWAVGEVSDNNRTKSVDLALHWDGHRWTRVKI